MHSKNNSNKSRNFIQGLRPFSSSVPKNLKKYLKKGGYNYSNIVDNWTKIVNKKISDACYPVTIKTNREMKDGILILNVIHGKELEIEYEKNNIIDKINSFFGYNCIGHVNLRIIEKKLTNKQSQFIKIKNVSQINEKIDKVKNNQLKNSLNNFLKAFNDRSK
jgi:hypothetical protein